MALYNINQVAEEFGVTTGRIRQILGAHNSRNRLGQRIGHGWIFNERQLNRLREVHAEIRSRRQSEKISD